jgi:DNA gyrase/topoisomerase IV subunit B
MLRPMGYTADDIVVMHGLAPVRARPWMYVGDVAQPAALHELVEAVLCGSFDEALGGTCTRIEVEIDRAGVVTVRDDGPGLPVAVDPQLGLPACELLLTTLYACRAMRRDPRAAKRFCGGGIAVTTALSAWLEVEIDRDGRRYRQRFVRGVREAPLADVGASNAHGTALRFAPDPEIFGDLRVDPARLEATLDEIRALVPAATIVSSV